MLIKEYRIGLPMSVEEYRIAQLYMIQKKSREESQGAGSGVEIIVNEPYKDGPGGNGQYTYKIYHIGSHLPGWFRAILPKSAMRVEEEAWNAYPYTKTRYRCPFIEKFLLEIETKYLNDGGEQQNLFNLSNADVQQRAIDYLDIVKDSIPSGDYKKEEDPKIFVSQKTGRGPLTDSWRDEYLKASRDPNVNGCCVMTAYKLCRVEFRYWGMQNKIERFIHDIGLRKTMLRAHRQAWCWQDEWHGLEISDIRRLEFETQKALAEKMANANESEDQSTDSMQKSRNKKTLGKHTSVTFDENVHISGSMSNGQIESAAGLSKGDRNVSKTLSLSNLESVSNKPPKSLFNGEVIHDWRFDSLEKLQESSSDDEFYDAPGPLTPVPIYGPVSESEGEKTDEAEDMMGEPALLIRSSSMEFESTDDEYADAVSRLSEAAAIEESPLDRRVEHFRQQFSSDISSSTDTTPLSTSGCRTNILFLVLHGGSLLDSSSDNISKRSDFSTIKSTFGNVIRTHYPAAIGHITFRLVACPPICSDSLRVLSSLSPFSFDSPSMKSGTGSVAWSQDFVPLGAIALLASSNPDHQDHINTLVAKANYVYQEFLSSEKGKGFTGQVCILADATGSLLAYDALCQSRPQSYRESSKFGSHSSLENIETLQSSRKTKSLHEHTPSSHVAAASRQLSQSNPDLSNVQTTTLGEDLSEKQLSKSDIVSSEYKLVQQSSAEKTTQAHLNVHDKKTDLCRRTSDGSHYDGTTSKFDFDVSDCFFFGSPLGLILAHRRLYCGEDNPPLPPACHQVYNLFHSSDPMAIRMEPLLHDGFKHISAVKVPRFNKFPLGDWESCHVVEAIQSNIQLFVEHHHGNHTALTRQESISSVCSQTSGIGENTVASIANVTSKWWGTKRLDYVLYCPEVLHSFPVNALPHLFHASFWESTDVVAFILRQLLRIENYPEEISVTVGEKDGERLISSTETQPKEKWLKRKTALKVRNLNPNHRANDVIVLEDKPQILTARFMYGALDVTALSGEKVDVHIMEQPSGEWQYMGTDLTDSHGRLFFTLPKEKRQSQGIHSVKMVVRGDHSTADFFLTVLPPKTETVVFSIDGSFTASMSIMGKDPKVRAGAVDVVRHWQELGYLILYVTARPDLQHRKVVAWLAQHNFPHGMVAFMDGFSKEPIKQKMYYLKSLMQEAELVYKAAYGSSKDIYVYKELGLKPAQMFIVGKAAKKLYTQAQVLSEGYATHLTDLMAPGGSRQAVGNALMFLRKSCFGLPVQTDSKKLLKRTTSNQSAQTGSDFVRLSRMDSRLSHPQITVSDSGNTLLEPGQSKYGSTTRARGTSPRPKMSLNQNP